MGNLNNIKESLMNRYLKLFLLILFPFAILQANDKDNENKALIMKLYRSGVEDAPAVLEEVLKLEIPKETVQQVLQKRVAKAQKDFDFELQRVNSSFRYIQNEKSVDSYLKNIEEWDKNTKEAMSFIFNDTKYAVPPKAMTGWIAGEDIQPNQAIVEGMVENCVVMYNAHEAVLAKLLGVKAKTQRSPGGGSFAKLLQGGQLNETDQRQVRVLSYKFTDIGAGLVKAIPKWQKMYKSYKSASDALNKEIIVAQKGGVEIKLSTNSDTLTEAILALFSEETDYALKLSSSFDEKKKRLFNIVIKRYLLSKSLNPKGEWSKQEIEILALNNLYRLSMGLNPLIGNENIQKAATGHTQYQLKNGMGHYQKFPETKGPMDRARKAGYTGNGYAENVSQGIGTEVIWRWRCDAGHHRNLINPNSRASGISSKGTISTFNAGNKAEDEQLDKIYSIAK